MPADRGTTGHYLAKEGSIPRWVERGMDTCIVRAEQMRHRVQMLLGVFGAKGVLPLEFKPDYSLGDLLVQHLDEMEQEAESKDGIEQVLRAHFVTIQPDLRCWSSMEAWRQKTRMGCSQPKMPPCGSR